MCVCVCVCVGVSVCICNRSDSRYFNEIENLFRLSFRHVLQFYFEFKYVKNKLQTIVLR